MILLGGALVPSLAETDGRKRGRKSPTARARAMRGVRTVDGVRR